MERLSYWAYCWFSRIRNRIRRRFTQAGLVVVTAIFVTGLLGIDTEQSVAYQAFAILCSMLLVALLTIPFFRAKFSITRLTPRLASAGQRLSYLVRVRNETDRPQRELVLQEVLAHNEPTYAEYHQWLSASRRSPSFQLVTKPAVHQRAILRPVRMPAMLPGQEVEVRVDMLPLRRGRLELSGCRFARADPFGLVYAVVRSRNPGSVLILPKRYPLPPLSLPGNSKYQQGGVALASSVGESQEYLFLREYRRGDPMRHVHWRSWARLAKPIVKEFQDEFFVRHALILDTFRKGGPDDLFEEAVSVAASFAYAIQTQESLLDLMFVGPEAYCFTAGRGLGRTEQLLEILAAVGPCQDHNFEVLERLVLGHAAALSGCICVLQAWDEPRRRLIERLLALSVPCQVLLLCEPGKNRIEPEPLAGPGQLTVLELGRVGKDLAALQKSANWSKLEALSS